MKLMVKLASGYLQARPSLVKWATEQKSISNNQVHKLLLSWNA